jgi:hypothetical protein
MMKNDVFLLLSPPAGFIETFNSFNTQIYCSKVTLERLKYDTLPVFSKFISSLSLFHNFKGLLIYSA